MSNVVCLFVLMLLPILVVSQTSRVQGFSVARDQRESYILEAMQPFCFLPEGVLRVRVRDISFYDPRAQGGEDDKTMDFPLALMKTAQAVIQDGHKLFSDEVLPLGLLVRHVGDAAFTASSEVSLQHSASGGCLFERELSKGNDDRLFYFTASNATFSFKISPESAGLSVIMFANCYSNYLGVSYSVSFDIENPGGVRVSAGARRAAACSLRSFHTPAGDAALPSVYLVFACLMASAAVQWARELSRNAAHVVGIHRVMGALVVVKSVWLALASVHWYWLKWTGSSSWWTLLMYIVQFIDGMVMFGVILLIGTGWSFLKPYLHPREKRLLMTVLPMQAVVNVAYVVMSEESPAVAGWLTWRDVLHILDITCCCLVLFPIVWSIRQLRESASVDGRAEVTFQRLILFRSFYVQVVIFVYFTRIVAYLVRATMPCRFSFMSDVASETATLIFFVTAGLKFRPRPENPYLALSQDEEIMISPDMEAAAGL